MAPSRGRLRGRDADATACLTGAAAAKDGSDAAAAAYWPSSRLAGCVQRKGRGRRGHRHDGVDAAHHVRGRGCSGNLEVASGSRGLTGVAAALPSAAALTQ